MRFSVPKEAVQLDFVFSNVMSGDGIYDNRGGFDYHLPIAGGTGTGLGLKRCPLHAIERGHACAAQSVHRDMHLLLSCAHGGFVGFPTAAKTRPLDPLLFFTMKLV